MAFGYVGKGVAIAAAGLALATAAGAAPSPVPALAEGRLVVGADGRSPAELVSFGGRLGQRLLGTGLDQSIAVAGWPTAAGERRTLDLRRIDVYAQDAALYEIRGERVVEIPRSRLAFFVGAARSESPPTRVLVSVDPVSGELAGLAMRPGGSIDELRRYGKSGSGLYLVAPSESFLPDGSESPQWACGEEGGGLESLFAASSAPEFLAGAAITSLHTATIAVDTDNELMLQKFNNDTTAATNYIASLFAAMNVIYERDLLVRLVQGTTFLRPSTTADPYSASCSGSACSARLNEFGNYWAGGCGGSCSGVPRALAMMLSGKQTSSNSASGIAWVNGLCSSNIGYSFSQVFKINYLAGDTMIVAHELGHNFGSPHTHCYSPPIDSCYGGEGGCYAGGTACPAQGTYSGLTNVQGTLMSYCHLLGGCSASPVFHPRTIDLLDPIVQSRVGVCVFPASFFQDGFESSLLPGSWGAKTP